MDEQELQRLYDAMSAKFDIGNFNDFKSKMSFPDDRQRFYNAVSDKGIDLGDYKEYESRLSNEKKNPSDAQTGSNISVTPSDNGLSNTPKDNSAFAFDPLSHIVDKNAAPQEQPETPKEVKILPPVIPKYAQTNASSSTSVVQPQATGNYNDFQQTNTAYQESHKKNVDQAIDNTAKNILAQRGVKVDDSKPLDVSTFAQLNDEKKKLQDDVANGDATFAIGKDGTLGLKKTVGFWESLKGSFNKAVNDNSEADAFVNDMNAQQKVDYLKKQESENPYPAYLGTRPSTSGSFGELVGSNTPFLGKAAAGAAVGTGLIAAAPETMGSSLAGLPAALSFAFTAPDMINQGAKAEQTRRFYQIKKENPQISDVEAMQEAEQGKWAGGLAGLATNALLMDGGAAEALKAPISQEGKSVIGDAIKNTLKSAVHMGATTAGVEAAKQAEGNLEGIKATPTDIAENAGKAFVDTAPVGGLLHVVTGAVAGAFKLPKVLMSAAKDELAKQNPEILYNTLKMNEENGTIPQGTSDKVIAEIDKYKQSSDKVIPGLSPEAHSSVAGLIQAKDNLIEEQKSKDESAKPFYDAKINFINDQIKNIIQTGKPYEFELNETTGEKYGKEPETKLSQPVEGIDQATGIPDNPLKDVISTHKALMDLPGEDFIKISKLQKDDTASISKEYHKAKSDGSNPELVKAVEETLTPKSGIPDNAEKIPDEFELNETTGDKYGKEPETKLTEPVEGLNKQGIPIKPESNYRTANVGNHEGEVEFTKKKPNGEVDKSEDSQSDIKKQQVKNISAWTLPLDKGTDTPKGETMQQAVGRVITQYQKDKSTEPDNTTIMAHSSVLKMIKTYEALKDTPEFKDANWSKLPKELGQKFAEEYNKESTQNGDIETFKSDSGNKIHIARHGQTEDNLTGKFRTNDTKLTEKGERQAEQVGQKLKEASGGEIPKIISSDLPRAIKTSEIARNELTKTEPIESKEQPTVSENELKNKSDSEIEKRMAEIENSNPSFLSPEQKEFNELEKEMERRERDSVFNVPLEKVNDAVDALIKKEKDKPNGYGAFIEKRDARETKEVANKYLNPQNISDKELMQDFSDAVRGNPTTWYADGLKLRESLKEATNRGIDTHKMLERVTKVYTDEGYSLKTAKEVVAGMLKPIFEKSENVSDNTPAPIEYNELPQHVKDIVDKYGEANDKTEFNKKLAEAGYGTDYDAESFGTESGVTFHKLEPEKTEPKQNINNPKIENNVNTQTEGNVGDKEKSTTATSSTENEPNGNTNGGKSGTGNTPTGNEPPTNEETGETKDNEGEGWTSIKNAVTDNMRDKLLLNNAEAVIKKTFGTTWDEAKSKIENGYNPQDLINELKIKPRPLTDVEDAILLYQQNSKELDLIKTNDFINKAAEEGNKQDLEEGKIRKARLLDELQDIYDVGKKAGTETARGLSARRMMVDRKYSLVNMMAEKRATSNDGEPLTPEQEKQVKELHKKIKETQDAFDEYVKNAEQEIKNLQDKVLGKGIKDKKTTSQKLFELADKIDKETSGKTFSSIVPISPKMLSTALRIVAEGVKKGEDLVELIKKAVLEIKKSNPEQDEEKLKKEINKAIIDSGIISDTKKVKEVKDYSAVFDKKAQKLLAENQRAKDEYDISLKKDEAKKRTPFKKIQDVFIKWQRAFKLTNPITMGKLAAAAVTRGLSTPAEDIVGGLITPILPKSLTKGAIGEGGGLKVKETAQAYKEGIIEGMRDSAKILSRKSGGKSDIDVIFGKGANLPPEAIDFFGQLHSATKAPIKRIIFERQLLKRLRRSIAAGIDVSDPMVQTEIALGAYKDANRAIFMQDNSVAKGWQKMADHLESSKNIGTSLSGTALKWLVPFVKVPTNIAAEIGTNVYGVPVGFGKIIYHSFKGGMENLSADEKDAIIRNLKKGSLGAAALLLGYFNPQVFGGYYQDYEKRKEGDAKANSIKIGDVNIPAWLIESPIFQTMQIGSTIRRVKDSKVKGQTQGIGEGIWAANLGMLSHVPMVDQPERVLKAITKPKERDYFLDELLKNTAEPSILQKAAEWSDDEKRKPHTLSEHMEAGIPILRKNVPIK